MPALLATREGEAIEDSDSSGGITTARGKTEVSQRPPAAASRRLGRKLVRVALIVVFDLLAAGLGLVVFALFHHVIPKNLARPTVQLAAGSPLSTAEGQTLPGSALAASSRPAPPPRFLANRPEAQDFGQWGRQFADLFSDGEVRRTANSYISRDINLCIERIQENGVTYYLADVYIRNLANFRTAFAQNQFGRGITNTVPAMAVENDAILAITGDYYGIRASGLVIRNGQLYRDSLFDDILVLNHDGSMETWTRQSFNFAAVLERGAWQAWSFGPMLLDHGQPMTEFNSLVATHNPRSAVGYYEPGHYCFVLVDGRRDGYSTGLTLRQLSRLFYDLGCSVAYNLDGGQSAVMTFMGDMINQPYKGGRNVSDIVFIAETLEGQP
ncbi:MAG: hypothetical protein A2087_14385 [Spirochaetes bacterium GWD1_61_31]|nr:MAG: hypothetical protein A2Y37_04275 [Spirochaetes bacterium GWB1_60_80]OHD30592.1 MAG: hypothetical protein A2004_05665 [Spirochaetes bacterium GWC1_61_12]OHD34861.1 MAG: hypothetical protein A2087_14385 [Spirochaetes bacterium GWD1_61_31]OHD46707.1 MAG: hypothetical protein A2Y35_11210 [Spirochaetes bacterium GWE1_60_18]OHD60335.1 MAG: hypothetical protein A2Y32_14775 [Spirochaetes bacterium GWF1_60_12]HAP44236.1 hypothetical protein [Spirochaetaceae bacterium]